MRSRDYPHEPQAQCGALQTRIVTGISLRCCISVWLLYIAWDDGVGLVHGLFLLAYAFGVDGLENLFGVGGVEAEGLGLVEAVGEQCVPAVGLENGEVIALLYSGYFERCFLTLGQQREQLPVDIVDAAAQHFQVGCRR